MKPCNCEQAPRDPSQWDGLDTYPVAQVEAFVQRIDELEAENKGLSARVAELEAENKTLRDRFSDADTERNAAQAALKAAFARVAELEARTREAEESNANALARLSAAEATIELRRIENEAVRRQLGHAENACDAMEKRVFDTEARCKRLEEAGDAMLRAWLMPEDSMPYADWVCLSSDAKSGWYAAKEAKP